MYQGLLDSSVEDFEKYTDGGSYQVPSISPLKGIEGIADFNSAGEHFSESILVDDDEPQSDFEDEEVTEETVARKEKIIEEYKKELESLQERLIWDLSLAIKRKLCAEKGLLSPESCSISQVLISSIVNSIKTEKPSPKTWVTWITEKFTRAL